MKADFKLILADNQQQALLTSLPYDLLQLVTLSSYLPAYLLTLCTLPAANAHQWWNSLQAELLEAIDDIVEAQLPSPVDVPLLKDVAGHRVEEVIVIQELRAGEVRVPQLRQQPSVGPTEYLPGNCIWDT